MKRRRGSLDFNNRGTDSVVRTWVPETLVSQLLLKASRMLERPLAISWSKEPPPLLTSTSSRPYLDVMLSTAFSREESDDKSTWRVLKEEVVEGCACLTEEMASSPLETVRQPTMISYAVDVPASARTISHPRPVLPRQGDVSSRSEPRRKERTYRQ